MRERKDTLLVGDMIYFTNSLACVLGDANQAAMLQQVFWWMCQAAKDKTGRIGKFEDGRWWTYQEMPDWRERFSWMSDPTLRRTRKKLEEKGLLIRKDEADPRAPGGVRIWLSVDENRLEQLQDEYLAALENEDDEGSPSVGGAPEGGTIKVENPPEGGMINVIRRSDHSDKPLPHKHNQADTTIQSGSAAPAADAALAAAPNNAAPLEQKQTPS